MGSSQVAIPVLWWFPVVAGLLLVPALVATWRAMSFEHTRWQESDHAGGGSSDDGDDNDSDSGDDNDS